MMINQPVTGGEFEFVPHMRDKVDLSLYVICFFTRTHTHTKQNKKHKHMKEKLLLTTPYIFLKSNRK